VPIAGPAAFPVVTDGADAAIGISPSGR